MENTNRLQPVAALFKGGWELFRKRFDVLVGIATIPAIISFVGRVDLQVTGRHFGRLGSGIMFGELFTFLGGIVMFIATIAMIHSLQEDTGVKDSYGRGFNLFWPGVWLCILNVVITAGAYLMLIVPGIILSIGFTFAFYSFTLEGKRGMAALKQSREYVRGFWWAILGRAILVGLIFVAAAIVVYVPATIIFGFVAGEVVYAVMSALFIPYYISVWYTLFNDVRRVNVEAPARAAASKGRFYIVSAILAIAVAIVLFFAALAVGIYKLHAIWESKFEGGGAATSTVLMIPSSGPVGTSVDVSSMAAEFARNNIVLMKGSVAAVNVSSADGKALTFAVPQYLGPFCAPGRACPQIVILIATGTYPVSVIPSDATSTDNAVQIGTFTVIQGK